MSDTIDFGGCLCCGDTYCAPLPPVPRYINRTKVKGYISTGANPDTTPYARPWQNGYEGDCRYADTDSPFCNATDHVKCASNGFDGTLYGWPTLSIVPLGIPIPAGIVCDTSVAGTIKWAADNCYREDGTVTVPRTCIGWKGVQAYAVWPGRFGFLTCCASTGRCSDGSNPQFKYSAISQTQHARIDRTVVNRSHDEYGWFTATGVSVNAYDWTQTAAVDGDGNLTRSGSRSASWSNDYSYVTDDPPPIPPVHQGESDVCGVTWRSDWNSPGNGAGTTADHVEVVLPASNPDASDKQIKLPGPPFIPTATCNGTISWNGHEGTVAELNAMELFRPPNNWSSDTTDGSGVTLHRNMVASGNPATFTLSDSKIKVTFNGTFTYYSYSDGGSMSPADVINSRYDETTSWEYTVEIKLTGSITWGSVVAKAKVLLNQWRLQDDMSYPWRTDAATWLQPLVTADAAPTQPTISWPPCDPITGAGSSPVSEIRYTGKIRGGPLPQGCVGTESPAQWSYYDFNHVNWVLSFNSSTGISGVCADSLGSASPFGVYNGATQWTEHYLGCSMYGPGAHITQLLHNTVGTFGQYVITDGVLMQKWCETLEAWPKINAARPCGPDRYLTDCDGNLRFPTARAIPSSLHVTAAVQPGGAGTYVTVTTESKHYLKPGNVDSVDFTGVGTLGAGVQVYSTPSETTFMVLLTGTLGVYGGGGTVRSTLSASPDPRSWHDTCPEYTYLKREWQSQHRAADASPVLPYYVGGGTQAMQAAILPDPEQPTVLWCSPNEEDVFPHGKAFAFGGINADVCCGEEWHLDFVQTMTDPYYIHCTGDTWPCGDYPYPPLVGVRLTMPSGAPALPAGLTLFPSTVATPSAVGPTAFNDITPRARMTCHAVRGVWLACNWWRDFQSHKCDSL